MRAVLWLYLGLGLGCALGSAVLIGHARGVPPVTAVPITATVAEPLPSRFCGGPRGVVDVTFSWRGRAVSEEYDAPSCDRKYRAGDRIRIYAASNDPSNLGPDPEWILKPDEHDPFDVFGPNVEGAASATLGAGLAAGAVVSFVLASLVWRGLGERG